jgi:ribonuclease P protein component
VGPFAVSEPKIGFIVSKKIHKRAVQRNRIRRRLRELVRTSLLTERRQVLSQYKMLVFIARSGCVEASFQTLAQRMERCFASLKKS